MPALPSPPGPHPRATAERRPLAGLQQHDLLPATARRLVALAGIRQDDQVVEVGPGLGALTGEALAAGAVVHAVERDGTRVAHLRQRFAAAIAGRRLHLAHGDARHWRPAVAGPWRVLANPPFNLTADLVRGWLLDPGPAGMPMAMDLLLQREAAGKLGGGDREQTRSSALLRLAGTMPGPVPVARDEVTPPARVDLAWWRFRRHADVPSAGDLSLADALLDRAFAGPHTVADALRGLATAEQVRRQARLHGYRPTDHPRHLAPAAWLDFARHLAMCGKLSPGVTAGPAARRRPATAPRPP